MTFAAQLAFGHLPTVMHICLLLVVVSAACSRIGYYCIAHCLSICPKCNSSAGDTAKTTGQIYFSVFFNARSLCVDNQCLSIFFKCLSCLSKQTIKIPQFNVSYKIACCIVVFLQTLLLCSLIPSIIIGLAKTAFNY